MAKNPKPPKNDDVHPSGRDNKRSRPKKNRPQSPPAVDGPSPGPAGVPEGSEHKKTEAASRASKPAPRATKKRPETVVKECTAQLERANRALRKEVAERRRAEEAVKAERQRFNDVLETLPAYLVLLTPDHHVPFANRFFRERFGESHGRRCFEYLFQRTEPCEVCETYKVLETMKPLEWEWTGPDGRNYYIYDFPFTDIDGSTLIMETGIDITERKRAESALKEANETLERRVAERTAALQEANGRLQAQAEELRTANEALVALNQKLQTANEELDARAEELRVANQELRESEGRLTYLASFPQRNPSPVLEVDLEGHVRYLNPAAERLFPDLQQRGPEHPWLADWAALVRAFREGRTDTSVRDLTIGKRTYQQAFYYSAQDRFVRIYGFDITKRKRAEEALQEAHEQLGAQTEELQAQAEELTTANDELRAREQALHESEESARQRAEELTTLMDLTPTALWVSNDPQCRVITGNRAARQFYEAAEDENLSAGAIGGGQDFTRRFFRNGHELRPEELPMQEAAARGVDVRDAELDVLLPSGRRITILGNASPLLDADGNVRGSIAAFVDITERKTAEEKVFEAQERLRALMQAVPVGVSFSDDATCRQITGNPAVLAQFQVRPEDNLSASAPDDGAPGRQVRYFLEGRQISDIELPLQRAVAENRDIPPTELEIELPSGRRWFAQASGAPIRDAQGNVVGGVAVTVDVTERKQAEQRLAESEQRLRLALEGGGMGRWEWDLPTDSMFCCERSRELLGLGTSSPGSGESLFRHVHPDDKEALARLGAGTLAEPADFQVDFRVLHHREDGRGEIRWLVSRGRVIHDEQGQAVRVIAVLHDITPRKQMEEQLRRLNDQLEQEVVAQTEALRDTIDRLQDEVARRVLAEGKLRKRSQMLEAFFQHTISPLAFMDKYFNFVRVNEAFARANDKTPELFVGKNHFTLFPHEENQAIFQEVVRTKKPYHAYARPFVYAHNPERGVSYWNWQLTPLLNEFGDVQSLVLNLEDVTERQKAFHELEQRARQLQKLTLELSQAEDRERKRLAEILHDDLQQQLAAAKFHLGILSTRVKDDTPVHEMAGQLNLMLKDAIEKSRSLSHELSPAVLYQSDLGETFEWLAREVQAKHGLTVQVEVRGRVDPKSEAIRAFLFKAGREILFNVVKHARTREAKLRLQQVREQLRLTITDNGQGFDPETLGSSGGFGLLSIRERVELLGGRMKIKSVRGKGSAFVIAVPDAGPTETAAPAAPGPAPKGGAAGPKLRVLLVDDHKVVREGLAVLLGEQRDLEVVGQAGNGREAVDLAYRLQPDVVIMDAAMPVMPGDEATRQIKLHLPVTRIIGLSMFAEAEMAERMRDAGAEAYLLKTAPSEELLAAIRGAVRE